MSERIQHPDLPAFLRAAREGGARAVAIRAVDEVRPTVRSDGTVVVGRVLRCDLSALAGSTVHALRVEDRAAEEVEAEVRAAGFPTRIGRGNIT